MLSEAAAIACRLEGVQRSDSSAVLGCQQHTGVLPRLGRHLRAEPAAGSAGSWLPHHRTISPVPLAESSAAADKLGHQRLPVRRRSAHKTARCMAHPQNHASTIVALVACAISRISFSTLACCAARPTSNGMYCKANSL